MFVVSVRSHRGLTLVGPFLTPDEAARYCADNVRGNCIGDVERIVAPEDYEDIDADIDAALPCTSTAYCGTVCIGASAPSVGDSTIAIGSYCTATNPQWEVRFH